MWNPLFIVIKCLKMYVIIVIRNIPTRKTESVKK